MDDKDLLAAYAKHHSEQAFDELTRRYVRLVYSTCRRELTDPDLAHDVTQAVFLLLAQRAGALSRRASVAGWLFQTSLLASRNARRQEQRRVAREQRVAEQMYKSQEGRHGDGDLLLNEALGSLSASEREAVLLRFMGDRTYQETGAELGISEDGARKRIDRALVKLQRFLTGKSAAITVVGVTALLEARSAEAVPEHILHTVLTAGHAVAVGGTLSLTSAHVIAQGVGRTMLLTNLKIAATIGVALAVGVGVTGTALKARPMTASTSTPATDITGPEVAKRCIDAYSSAKTFQGTATSADAGLTASAKVTFTAPDNLRVDGQMLGGGGPYSLLSTAGGTFVNTLGSWQTQPSAEMGIGACTGISGMTSATLPAMLLHTNWGNPFVGGAAGVSNAASLETVDGRAVYHLTYHSAVPANQLSQATTIDTDYWVDRKTYFLVKLSQVVGPTTIVEHFTAPTIDAAVPASTYAKPAVAP